MKWTEAQQQTIDTRGKNILVSAAAGSGKTAVLVERIKQLVIKDKVDIDRFLITTFTKAASAEMKERLEAAVKDAMEQPGADRAYLRKQLDLLPDANISTFHTFALEVMRRYFYLTDLEPGFKIGDETKVAIIKNDVIDRVFEDRFENDYERFTSFLRKYSSDRSERRIKQNILDIYNEMRSIPGYISWAQERCSLMSGEHGSPMEVMGLKDYICSRTENVLKEAAEFYIQAADVLEDAGLEGLYAKASEDADTVTAQYETFREHGDCEQIRGFLSGLKFNTMRAGANEKDGYAEVKDQVASYRKRGKKLLDDIKNRYYVSSFEAYDEELIALYDDTEYMTGLIKEFEEKFRAEKHERNIIDFDDVMHYAIEILGNEAAAEYREKFMYIFIDEFQDSNGLQEKITDCIKREDNLFMVGDVKQSIYKFRLAEPEIFREKYRIYKKAEEEKSIKIDLNSNFRSKANVTGTVNDVFDGLMEDYDDDARLYCTAPEDTPGEKSQLHIISIADEEGGGDIFYDTGASEASLTAELIRENLGKEIFDAKAGIWRPVEYRDIAVLSRSRSMIPDIEKHLNNEGIPAYGENTGGYFESIEVQVFINILKVVNNTRQDISLISVMRSVIFGFTASELAEIRISCREGSFYGAVDKYEESGSDDVLRTRIKCMKDTLEHWKELSRTVALEELVRTLVYDTGYYDYCSSLPAGRQRTSNLQLLIDRAAAFEQSDYTGLYGFLSYVEAMDRNRLTADEAKITGENEDLVRVMTVHKSKGLEFPVVILTGAGRQIKYRGSGSPASMHKDTAIGLPVVDKEECWHRKSVIQKVTDDRKAQENTEEEIRILYVALTRAKDKLIITGSVKYADDTSEFSRGRNSFLEMVCVPMQERGDEVIIHRAASLGQQTGMRDMNRYRKYNELEAEASLMGEDERYEQIDRLLSFRYPHESSSVKSKYSVTELNRIGAEEDVHISLPKPMFSIGKKRLSASEIGTAVHTVMEKLEFATALREGKSYVVDMIGKLEADGTIPEESSRYIDVEKITAFFASDIGARAAAAQRLEKEREFIMQMELEGTETIVQGIIDCYFCEADGIVLIDYKNVKLIPGSTEADIAQRYCRQIDVYRNALEAAEGRKVKEAYLYLFDLKKFIKIPRKVINKC